METKLESLEFDFSAFTNWNALQEYLTKQGATRAQLKTFYKQWKEENQKPSALNTIDLCDAIKSKTDGLKIDSAGLLYRDGVKVYANESALCRELEKDFDDSGCRFSYATLQKELKARLRSLPVYDIAFETLQQTLSKDVEPLPSDCPFSSWCACLLRHFGFSFDDLTQARFYDFVKRQINRVINTYNNKADSSVNSMLVLYGKGNIGKSWLVNMLNLSAFGFMTPPIQDNDRISVYGSQIQAQFILIEEQLNGFEDGKIKTMITSSKPIDRGSHKDVNISDLSRCSYILTCNKVQDSFANLASTTDSGMMRRFFILETNGEKIEHDWDEETITIVLKNVLREAAKKDLLTREDVENYNTQDFKKYIAEDNYVIKRIKTAIERCLESDEFISNNHINNLIKNHPYPKTSFRLWIERGNAPRGVDEKLYPEFEASALRRTRLSKSEIEKIYKNKKHLTLFEIGQEIGFDFSKYDIQ